MSAEARIHELKLELPPAPKPVAVYKPVVVAGNLAYVSGHGPIKSDKSLITGRVGAEIDLQAGKAAGCQTVRIYARALGEDEPKPNYQATDLSDAVQWILEQYRSSDILSIPPRAADVITTNCANS